MNKLIIVEADPFPPYQYDDEAGIIRGLDYEKVKKAFENAGYKIKILLDEWQKIEEAIAGEIP